METTKLVAQKTLKKGNVLSGFTFFIGIVAGVAVIVLFNKMFEGGMPPIMHATMGILLASVFVYFIYTSAGTMLDIMGFQVDKGLIMYILIILFMFFAFAGGN
jgi:Ca2+/Na+ antiporter